MTFTGGSLSIILVLFDLGIVFCLFLEEFVHLPTQHLGLCILLGHEVGSFGKLDLQRGVLLLVELVLLEKGTQLLDLLILLDQGGLHPRHQLTLLSKFRDVVLVRLQVAQQLQVLAILPHPFIFKIA